MILPYADHANDLTTAKALEDCAPWNQRQLLLPFDDREFAARKHDGAAVGAANECSFTRRDVNGAIVAFGGEVFSDAIELVALQGRKQVGAVADTAIISALGQAPSDQVLLALLQRLLDLMPKTHGCGFNTVSADQ